VTAAARITAGVSRWLLASMMCALLGHAAVYRSLVPGDGRHGYFGWYVPLLGAASVCSLLVLVLGSLCAGGRAARALQVVLPARSTRSRAVAVGGLAAAGLLTLLVQESVERSIDSGAVTVATFDASRWPVLLAVLVLAAAAIHAVGRTVAVLSHPLRVESRARLRSGLVWPADGRAHDTVRTTAPLARHAGLRAPPLVA